MSTPTQYNRTKNTSVKNTSVKKKVSEEIKTSAAKTIQEFFLKKYKQYKQDKHNKQDKCSIQEQVSLKPENIYICLNNEGEEIPLVNFFRFKKKDNVIAPDFLNFYNYIKNKIDIETVGKNMFFKINLFNDKLNIVAHEKIFNKMHEDIKLKNMILDFICYNLVNNNINLSNGISFDITHPMNFSEFSGIHKDDSIHTCITYINSPVTTEIAFDTDAIKLEWLKCSPLFRFNTTSQITTLCFSDHYIHHTVPIYEEEGKPPHELNKLDGETMTYHTTDNGMSYIVFSEKGSEPNNIFLKTEHRKKIKKPEIREVLVCFIHNFNNFDSYRKPYSIKPIKNTFITEKPYTITLDDLQKYKIYSVQEKIELTNESIHAIRTNKTLGDFELMGGKTKNKRTKKNKFVYRFRV